MKNLLYIGNHLSEKGKTETTIETLSRSLEGEGFKVFVASNKKNKLVRLLDMILAVLKYSRKVDFVLIDTYSTSNFYYAYLCSQLSRLLNLKYIPILHGGNLPKRLEKNPKLSKAIFEYAHKNIAPSGYMKYEFEKQGYSNVLTIPNAIKLKNYDFKQRNYKTIKLLWVRSFSEIYNPLLAIKILKYLIDEGKQAELCMVGPDNDGSLMEAKKYADQIGVEVRFTGKLSKKEWIKHSNAYNIFINTTNYDNMPVSVIEAMALGLPIISTNVGGTPFLIDNKKNGILVKPNSVESFVNEIKIIITFPEKANQMALQARKHVEQFDWNIVKKQWFKVLQ